MKYSEKIHDFIKTNKEEVNEYKPGDIIFENGFCKSFYKKTHNYEIWISDNPTENTHREYKNNTIGKKNTISFNNIF